MANYSQTWEQAGITKLLEAMKKSTCHVHVCNISAASSLNKIRQAKEWCKKITCEIPASHLIFSSMNIQENDIRFKCFPPIRNQANTNLLWDLLKIKGVDVITSTHVAICDQFKTGGFQKAVNGFQSIGFSLQAVWTTLNGPVSSSSQKEHYIVSMAKWLSLHPAEILNVSAIRGSICKGKYADLVVWNPYEKYKVTEELSPYPEMSPYLGMELYGKISKVFLRGNLVYNQGKFKVRGRLILRVN
jgi:allantoinase